ncbi:MAG: KR domain-containing protein [Chloroflexi bacterium]|nr:KR domain-containing protein [Acidobacteriota bacterium]MCA1587968.1 KR domain-containing protein [Chloroflexota bacterium]MCA1719553.1 KR domain-containing protein [Actinomycetota bacterium]
MTVFALAPVDAPFIRADRFVRRRWHVIGPDGHPLAAQLRARSAAPQSAPNGVAVLLNREFGWEDNARLLDAVAAARRDDARLVLAHLGAGGGSLIRVAALEEELEAMSIEISACPSARACRIAVSLANGVSCGDVRISDNGAITQTIWQHTSLPEIAPVSGTVLVTGGLGGLGLRAAHVLERVHGLRPVLLDNTSSRQRLPGHAIVLNADITSRAEVAAVLEGHAVHTVVHCAGVLHGGALTEFSSAELIEAQQVKVDGLRNVLAALDTSVLRRLVTFGSITADHPHRGMACYALANELLRRETLRVDLPGCAIVAAQWSLWSGAGMAHRAGAVPQARRMGMTPISLRAGMIALLRLLNRPPGHAVTLQLHGA